MTARRPPPDPDFVLRGHDAEISCLFRVEDRARTEDWLVVGDGSGTVALWDLVTRKRVWTAQLHSKPILGVWVGRVNGELKLVTHGRDHLVHIFNYPGEPKKAEKSIIVNALNYCRLAVLVPMGQGGEEKMPALAAVPGKEDANKIDLIDLTICEEVVKGLVPSELATETKKTGIVMALNFFRSPDGTPYLAAGYESGLVAIYPVSTDFSTSTAPQPLTTAHVHSESILSMSISSDSTILATGSADGLIGLLRLGFGPQPVFLSLEKRPVKNPGNASVSVRDDGKLVFAGNWDGRVRVMTSRGKGLASLTYHSDSVTVVLAGRGGRLFSGGKEGRVAVWRIYEVGHT